MQGEVISIVTRSIFPHVLRVLSSSVLNIFFSCLCVCKVVAIGQDTVIAVADTDHVVCELEFRKSQKEVSNGVLQRLRIKPTSKSHFSIPLYRLRGLPLVRPISEVEVQRLECEFVMGYQEGDQVMYISAFNNVPVDLPISCNYGFLELSLARGQCRVRYQARG